MRSRRVLITTVMMITTSAIIDRCRSSPLAAAAASDAATSTDFPAQRQSVGRREEKETKATFSHGPLMTSPNIADDDFLLLEATTAASEDDVIAAVLNWESARISRSSTTSLPFQIRKTLLKHPAVSLISKTSSTTIKEISLQEPTTTTPSTTTTPTTTTTAPVTSSTTRKILLEPTTTTTEPVTSSTTTRKILLEPATTTTEPATSSTTRNILLEPTTTTTEPAITPTTTRKTLLEPATATTEPATTPTTTFEDNEIIQTLPAMLEDGTSAPPRVSIAIPPISSTVGQQMAPVYRPLPPPAPSFLWDPTVPIPGLGRQYYYLLPSNFRAVPKFFFKLL